MLEEYSGGSLHVLAEHLLEEIYRDYHAKHLVFIVSPERSVVLRLRWRKAMRKRINNLCTGMPGLHRDNLVFVAILSISETFMEALIYSADDLWSAVIELLRENRSNIEFFARSRGVPWLRAVRELIPRIHRNPERILSAFDDNVVARQATPNSISDEVLHRDLVNHGANTFYLSMTGTIIPIQAPSFNDTQPSGLQVIDIDECIYDRNLFSQYSRTVDWPWQIWPRHPQLCEAPDVDSGRRERLHCNTCGNLFTEEWDNPDIGCQCHDWCVDALVQIVEYPPFPDQPDAVNRGVRALQSFDALTIIGEYTGMLVPAIYDPDSEICDNIYLFALAESRRRDTIACISARLYGNWTRFINHANDESKRNIEFVFIYTMNRLRVVVTTTRKIEFGEEILGDYGDSYWRGRTDIQ